MEGVGNVHDDTRVVLTPTTLVGCVYTPPPEKLSPLAVFSGFRW